MDFRVLSRENRDGKCKNCKDHVYEMAFVKDKDKNYYYLCYDCAGIGTSKRHKKIVEILEIDEARIAREEIVSILLSLAEEDERIFKDQRLTVVNSFKDEILEGIINEKLEKYIKFNGNDISEVLKLRTLAIEANKREGLLYRELVNLYKDSRIKKLSLKQRNRLKIILTIKEIQELDNDFKMVWDHLVDIKYEALRDSSARRYDNIHEIRDILNFEEKKRYLTEYQLKRLKSFYYEMSRRNKKTSNLL